MNGLRQQISNSAPVRKIASIFSLPIFWMLLGPPAVRIAVDDERSGLSSLEGDQDIWNIIRIVWWLLFGVIAIIQVVKEKRLLGEFLPKLGKANVFVGLYLAAMFASTIFSPVPMFTLANVTMIFLLVVAAVAMALKIYGGVLPVSRVLEYLLWTSVALLIFVSFIYLAFPQLVYRGVFGLRLRGESLAYAPLLSVISIVLGAHFMLVKKGAHRLIYLVPVLFGFYWLMLGQTRSAYLGMAVGIFIMFWANGSLARNFVNLAAVGVVGFVVLMGIGLLYGNSQRVTWYIDSNYKRFIVRDYWALQDAEIQARSLSTLNGRTEAANVLIDGVMSNPMGFGYIGGVRTYMSSPKAMAKLPDKAFIGAHNGYLEVLGGAGIFALLGYLGLLMWLVIHSWRFKNVDATAVLGILFVLLVEGMFESEIALPFHQSCVVLWILAAVIAASVAYERRVHEGFVEAAPTIPRFSDPVVQAYG